MRGGTGVFFTFKVCREVERLVGEVEDLRHMMESMKRLVRGLGLEEKGEETGDRMAELGEAEKCEEVLLIGCIRTPVEGRCSELHRVDVCGHFDTTLVSNTRLGQRQVLLLMFEVHQSVLPILYQPIVEVNCTGR